MQDRHSTTGLHIQSLFFLLNEQIQKKDSKTLFNDWECKALGYWPKARKFCLELLHNQRVGKVKKLPTVFIREHIKICMCK